MDKNERNQVAQGEVHLVKRVAGYKKIRYYTHENVGFGNVNLPDQEMHTTSVWWQVSSQELDQRFASRWLALDGFLGAAYAMHHVAALNCMCEARDVGRAVGNGDAEWFAAVGSNGRGGIKAFNGDNVDVDAARFNPTLFLYDNFPGGLGISSGLYEQRNIIIEKSLALVGQCNCDVGCPACIGPILPSKDEREYSPKSVALEVLNLLSAQEKTHESTETTLNTTA